MEDIDLNLEDFTQRVNSDLVGKYINIASRCAGFIAKRFDGKLLHTHDQVRFHADLPGIAEAAEEIAGYYEARDSARALRRVMALADQINQYVTKPAPSPRTRTRRKSCTMCTALINAFRLLDY